MTAYFQKQYALVRSSRGLIFDFTGSAFGDAGINTPLSAYMNKSIRDLLVHSASCYLHWLAYLALGQPMGSVDESGRTLDELRRLYERVDDTMAVFLDRFAGEMDVPINGVHDTGWRVTVTPHELFTHVTTHEFHHKGQIVLISRLLGHAPPDTDVSNFFIEQAPE
ncbi:DinB family protein [Puia sp.]|jgi:uncharacterized damage-inducible protein DinB|uniref:DinB family protein n=1 Tax=Puia sp. TaxID=2045100 RepID=UPI002F4249D6